MRLLVENIATLAGIDGGDVRKRCGSEMSHFDSIDDAWLLVEDGVMVVNSNVRERHKFLTMESGVPCRTIWS